VKASVSRVLVTCHLLLRQHTQAASYCSLAGEPCPIHPYQPCSHQPAPTTWHEAQSPDQFSGRLSAYLATTEWRRHIYCAMSNTLSKLCILSVAGLFAAESYQPSVVATSFLRFKLLLLQVRGHQCTSPAPMSCYLGMLLLVHVSPALKLMPGSWSDSCPPSSCYDCGQVRSMTL
jgi:hypothetical protein